MPQTSETTVKEDHKSTDTSSNRIVCPTISFGSNACNDISDIGSTKVGK